MTHLMDAQKTSNCRRRIIAPLTAILLALLMHCDSVSGILRLHSPGRVSNLFGAPLYSNPELKGEPRVVLAYNTPVRMRAESKTAHHVESEAGVGWLASENLRRAEAPLETFRYAAQLAGAPLYASPGGELIDRAAIAEKILCLAGVEEYTGFEEWGGTRRPRLERWLQVRTPRIEAWMRIEDLAEKPPQYHFLNVAQSGLNLRAEPDRASRALALIPFGHIGKALRQEIATSVIEDRRGAWLEVDYNGSRGYVFSGFVIIADDRETLEKGALRNLTSFRALYADSGAKYEVAERRAAFAAEGGYSVSRQTPLGAFVIEEMKPGSEFSECDPRAPVLLQFNAAANRVALIVSGGMLPPKTDWPLPDSAVVTETLCYCCCAQPIHWLLIARKDRLYKLPFYPGNISGGGVCEGDPGFEINYGREWRLSPDGATLYGLLRYPGCAVRPHQTLNAAMMVEPTHSADWDAELFVRIHAPGDADEIEILQRLNSGVPEDFASEWEAAQPLYDSPTKTPPPAPAAIDTDDA